MHRYIITIEATIRKNITVLTSCREEAETHAHKVFRREHDGTDVCYSQRTAIISCDGEPVPLGRQADNREVKGEGH